MPTNDRDTALLFAFVAYCISTKEHDISITSGYEDGTEVSFLTVSSAISAFLKEYGENR